MGLLDRDYSSEFDRAVLAENTARASGSPVGSGWADIRLERGPLFPAWDSGDAACRTLVLYLLYPERSKRQGAEPKGVGDGLVDLSDSFAFHRRHILSDCGRKTLSDSKDDPSLYRSAVSYHRELSAEIQAELYHRDPCELDAGQ